MVHTSPCYLFLSTHVSASQYILLPGCVMSGLQSMEAKATSPYLVAQRSTIIKLPYSLVFITMSHKASRISASKDHSFTFNVRVVLT